jgi:hypothetical protein
MKILAAAVLMLTLACGPDPVVPPESCSLGPFVDVVPADTGWRAAVTAGALSVPPDTSLLVLVLYQDRVTEEDKSRLQAAGATITSEWEFAPGLAFALRAGDLPSVVSPDGPLPDGRVRSAELNQPVCLAADETVAS